MRERLRSVHESLGTVVLAVLILAVVAGGALRLSYANWDEGGHLHPDERYLSSVANDIGWPSSPIEYFDVGSSPLSPYNTPVGRSYVYGAMPLFTVKAVAGLLGRDDYDHLYLVARAISAVLDTATIVLVFVCALLLLRELDRRIARVGAAVAALLYAFTVTAIQHAHYFTVDSWLVFFTMLTFLLALWALDGADVSATRLFNPRFALVGVGIGLTVACKVPGAIIFVPVAVALGTDALYVARLKRLPRGLLRLGFGLLVTVVVGYVSFRTVSPYAFAHSSWLDVSLNDQFRGALDDEFRRVNGAFLFPPSYQWLLSTPIWDPLQNLVRWQLGFPLGIAAGVGILALVVRIGRAGWSAVRKRGAPLRPPAATTRWLMLVAYVLAVFFWIAPRFAHMGRYLVPITPFLAIAAAYALVLLFGRHRSLLVIAAGGVVAATALYALAFQHVFVQTHPRVAATRWIVGNVAPGASIASEHWDDSLPIGSSAEPYRLLVLPVFEPDDDRKLRRLYDVLSQADYYAVSSPRAWHTIGRLPDRFPLMARFYRDLFAGQLGFERVAAFTSEPELLGVRVDDLAAEEAFWVYDHPPVSIFRRTQPLTWERFRATLCPTPDTACTSPRTGGDAAMRASAP